MESPYPKFINAGYRFDDIFAYMHILLFQLLFMHVLNKGLKRVKALNEQLMVCVCGLFGTSIGLDRIRKTELESRS